MLTNFEHGDGSGSIVYENELAYGYNPYVTPEISSRPSPALETWSRHG
jgi:hypothetical protein